MHDTHNTRANQLLMVGHSYNKSNQCFITWTVQLNTSCALIVGESQEKMLQICGPTTERPLLIFQAGFETMEYILPTYDDGLQGRFLRICCFGADIGLPKCVLGFPFLLLPK